MNKIIRWQGVAFSAIFIATLTLLSWLFLDPIIRYLATSSLQEVTGAEVNIGSVEHQFSPLQLTINNVQITDANAPTHNLVAFDKSTMGIEWLPALTGKLHITDLTIEALTANQLRDTPGQVFVTPETQANTDSEVAPWLNPEEIDVDSIIAKAPLKTPKAIAEFKALQKKHTTALKTQQDNLPSQQDIDLLKQKFDALKAQKIKTPQDLTAAKQQFDTLKDALRQHQTAIKSFNNAAKLAKAELSPALKALKDAPNDDYTLVNGLVSGDTDTIINVSQQVFGDSAKQWAEPVLLAIKKLAPLMDSAKQQEQQQAITNGRFISFTEQQPTLLIKQAKVDIRWQQEKLQSDWQDITYQHELLGRPTRFSLNSENSNKWTLLSLSGELSLLAEGLIGDQAWKIQDLNVAELSQPESDSGFSLSQGLLSGGGQLALKGEILDGSATWLVNQLTINSDNDSKVVQAIINSLNSGKGITLNNIISGPWDAPEFSIKSDLDRQLSNAVTQHYLGKHKNKLNKWKQGLTTSSNAEYQQGNSDLNQWQSLLSSSDQRNTSIKNMLNQQLSESSQTDSIKDKLKDKLKSKLFGG